MVFTTSLLAIGLAPLLAAAQLSSTVGPTTTYASKASNKICSILDYGGVADNSTDVGTAISSAWDACKDGGVVYIPSGAYALDTWVRLTGGSSCAIRLDGTIYRTGTEGGNMIYIEHTSDFELFSATSEGAVQGFGYKYHAEGSISGPRILRLYDVSDFSVHDLALVDSPSFHFSMDTCENGEVYNMAIRGGNEGGLDGIDVWSTNIWVHDVGSACDPSPAIIWLIPVQVMVTNKDECVTVKSPSHNILVENIYCNWSGGCAMGSLSTDVNISDVTYRNIYTWSSNQMYMIKSNGGNGSVSSVVLENFIGHGNAYSLDIDQKWSSMSEVEGDGVQLNNITIKNWKGTEADGAQRGPIKVNCADAAPCTYVTIEDFAMWTEEGDSQWYWCESAYGTGACLKDGTDHTSYTTKVTVTAAPSGYSAATMASDLSSAFGTDSPIPIPAIPTSFYPGLSPISPLAGASSTKAAQARASVSSSRFSSIPVASTSTASLAEFASKTQSSSSRPTRSFVTLSSSQSQTTTVSTSVSDVSSVSTDINAQHAALGFRPGPVELPHHRFGDGA